MKTIKTKELINWMREQKGKEFEAQARGPHAYDCVGLIVACANEFGINVNDKQGYSNTPFDGLFLKAINENLERITVDEAKKGDLIIFSWGGEYHHIAMIVDVNPIKIVHALSTHKSVVEHDFSGTSWERLRHKFYRFKDVTLEEEQGE